MVRALVVVNAALAAVLIWTFSMNGQIATASVADDEEWAYHCCKENTEGVMFCCQYCCGFNPLHPHECESSTECQPDPD